jgi:hypothetical protein
MSKKRPRENYYEHERPPKVSRTEEPCTCEQCVLVTQIATDTREAPSPALYRIVTGLGTCPFSSASYRRGLRSVLPSTSNLLKQLDEDSRGEEDTDDGGAADTDAPVPLPPLIGGRPPMTPPLDARPPPPTECNALGGVYPSKSRYLRPFHPPWTNLTVWERADPEDIMERLQLRFTPNSRHVFTHPRYGRVRTNFTDKLHDYFLDGIKRCAKNGWLSATGIVHRLWRAFNEMAASIGSGKKQLRQFLAVLLGLVDKEGTIIAEDDSESDADTDEEARKAALPVIEEMWAFLVSEADREGSNAPLLVEFYRDFLALFKFVRNVDEQFGKFAEHEPREKWHEILVILLAKEKRKQWKNARDMGSVKHNYYDIFLQGGKLPPGAVLPLGFLRAMAWLSEKYDVLGTEISLFDEEAQIISQADLILIDRETGEILVADFKNCENDDLMTGGAPQEHGTHPFSMFMNGSKESHYIVQVSIYRDMFNRFYYPGQVSPMILLLNFQPTKPLEFQPYWRKALELTPFRQRYMPWKEDSPVHLQFVLPAPDWCLQPFPDDHPDACMGKTIVGNRATWRPLNANEVWVCHAYKDVFPDSPFKHPWRWFQEGPPPGTLGFYESYLLNNPQLLHRIPELVGKKLICWCREGQKCHANVLVKYARLYDKKQWTLEGLSNVKIFEDDQGNKVPRKVISQGTRDDEDSDF